jgi:hypothetical protein
MTQVVRLQFKDGFELIAKPTDNLRLMRAGTYGIQVWGVQHLLDGIWPPCAPDSVWLHVTELGVEHRCTGLVLTLGTLAPVAPVEPPAPTVQDVIDIAISEATVPVEEPVVKKSKKGRAVA